MACGGELPLFYPDDLRFERWIIWSEEILPPNRELYGNVPSNTETEKQKTTKGTSK